ncbi:symmetrical bis(5'-nucleosyl)-tetraphosphatase [Paraburkholderia terrae]|uniref:Bis(5'-nucleosyl)-tetraphosphatase, symmetrical n=1 Tax=Paraburkholderia terrae TaxID=311230 RepID=A0ABM7TUT8_9BURK|nr:symmetrical bis(5'-nucleosyl)-tetraphosphatase [Paraburkholderia terrae]BCZ78703.1 bis(5'-nucleosyl)-tetraphosphatase, symmetrical [Paraburkholderia terrae]BDC39234.1 bis(5'-nucleosyl)-tetraphosphatase, symmetrical [Paraburkholderia terrae]
MTVDTASAPLAFGDLQGCRSQFQELLEKAAPPDDAPLWFAGDIINRGRESLATMRDLIALGDRAVTVLGNHDLHLLSVSAGIRKSKKGDTIDEILAAPDVDDLLEWIRHRPIAYFSDNKLLVHAGVLPQWDAALTMELAEELQRALRAPNWKETLAGLYGNEPRIWSPDLKGIDRLRVTCSALTRLRFCDRKGMMDFSSSGTLASAPPGCMPWFDVPGRKTSDITIVFGHWAALGLMLRDNLIGLDSGCVWGETLSAVRITDDPVERTLTQVECHGCRATSK